MANKTEAQAAIAGLNQKGNKGRALTVNERASRVKTVATAAAGGGGNRGALVAAPAAVAAALAAAVAAVGDVANTLLSSGLSIPARGIAASGS